MPVHMTGSFLPPQHEEVDVGDAVFLQQKGVTIEAAVVKKQGRRIKLLPEDRSGEMWVAPEQCDKVVTGGAEELMSRAAREAEKKAREEAARKAEADRKALLEKTLRFEAEHTLSRVQTEGGGGGRDSCMSRGCG